MIEDFGAKDFDGPNLHVRVDTRELDDFEKRQKQGGGSPSGGSPSGGSPSGTGPTGSPRGSRPSTQSPEKIAKTTAAAVEQVERTSQARQTAIAQEGEAKRASIESQGAQRRVNAEAQANARLQANEASHLQRMIQEKERAEQRLAMRPKMSQGERADKVMATGKGMMGTGAAVTAAVTAPIALGAGLALREGIKFESSFADVKKQVGGSPVQLEQLRMQIRDMAAGKNAIPTDVNELSAIAASAGQLGIARESVIDFTRVISEMKDTTNLTSEEAATSMAQIANITKMPATEYSRLGSTIVQLGNDGASTEKEITELTQRLSGVGSQMGLTVPQIAGMGSALASVGVNAESGGTGVSNMWIIMDKAVREGGKDLDKLAKISGMSASQFKKEWQTNAAGATDAFLVGIGKMKAAGEDPVGTLTGLGFTDSQMRDAMLRLAGAGDLLAKSLKTAEGAWKSNTALADEAKKKYETTASQLEILQNRISEGVLKMSDSVLKDANAAIGEISKGIPEAAQKIAASWEALGPAGKKAVLGLMAVVALTGPMQTLAGTVTTIYGGLLKVGSVVGTMRAAAAAASAASAAGAGAAAAGGAAGAAGSGAAGAGGLAAAVPLLANPATLIILTAAVIALAGAWAMYQERLTILAKAHKDVENNTKNLTQDLHTLGKAAEGNTPAETSVKRISKAVTDAGKDVNKLNATLDKVAAARREVKNLKLSPAAAALVTQQYDTLASRIESRIIKVQVEMDEQSKNWWDQFKEDLEREDWVPKGTFSKGGNRDNNTSGQTPAMVREAMRQYGALENGQGSNIPGARRPNVSLGQIMHLQRTGNLDALRNSGSPKERGEILRDLNVGKSTETVLKVIWAYYDRLTKANPAYIYDPSEARKLADINGQLNVIAQKKQKASKDAQDEATRQKGIAETERKQKAEAAAAERKKIQEAISDQKRAEVSRSFEGQLGDWNSFSGAIDAVTSSLAQTAEAGSVVNEKTARSKMEAQMAREEFALIPRPLKEAAIELAGIQAQLQKIVGTRDALRQTFNGISEGLGGGDQAKFAKFVGEFQKEIKLSEKANNLINQARGPASLLRGGIESNTTRLQNSLNANQLAGRGPFDKSDNPNDGNLAAVGKGPVTANMVRDAATIAKIPAKISACANVASQMLGSLGVAVESSNRVDVLEKNLQKAGAKRISLAEARAGDTLIWDTDLSQKYGDKRHYGAGSRKHVEIYEGNGRSSGNGGGVKRGNPAHLGAPLYDRNAIIVYQTSSMVGGGKAAAPVAAARIPAASNDPRQNWSFERQQALVGADGLLPWERAQNARKPAVTRAPVPAVAKAATKPQAASGGSGLTLGAFDGRLLTSSALPSSWGGSMNDYRAQAGESTQYRQQFEAMLLKMIGDGTKVSDKGIRMASAEGLRLDKSASIKAAGDESAKAIADMGRQIRLAGRENNPFFVLSDEFEHGQKQFLSKWGRSSELGMTLGVMQKGLEQANKELSRSSRNSIRAAGENRGMLGGGYNPAAYDRAEFATQKRFEIWDSPDIIQMSQVITKLRDEGKEHQALRLQKELNATATERLIDSLKTYDAQQASGSMKTHAEEMRRLTDEAAMLKYVAQLRQSGFSVREQQNLTEAERTRRSSADQLAPALATGTGLDYLQQISAGKLTQARVDGLAADAGDQAASNLRSGQGQSDTDALTNYNKAIRDNIALIRDQQGLYGLFGVDTPQLQTEIDLLQERAKLLSGEFADRVTRDDQANLTIPADLQSDLDKRLAAKREELKQQQEMNRFMDRRHDADAAEIRAIEMKKEGALQLAATERDRLKIEWEYGDALKRRVDPMYQPSQRELDARQGQLDQLKTNQTDQATRRGAEMAHDIFRDSIRTGVSEGIGAGLSGMADRLKQVWMDAAIDKLARRAAGLPADENATNNSDVIGAVLGRRRGRPVIPVPETKAGPLSPSGFPAAGPAIFNPIQVPNFVQNAVMQSPIAASLGGMLGSNGGMNAGNITITTSRTQVNSGVTNVNGGAGGLFGGRSKIGGGGSGTAASISQQLGIPLAGPGL